jgi:hypothetical protein
VKLTPKQCFPMIPSDLSSAIRGEQAESTDDAATKEREAKRLKAAAAEEPKKEPKPGEAGYRWHASVPQPSKMDYTKRPESKVSRRVCQPNTLFRFDAFTTGRGRDTVSRRSKAADSL